GLGRLCSPPPRTGLLVAACLLVSAPLLAQSAPPPDASADPPGTAGQHENAQPILRPEQGGLTADEVAKIAARVAPAVRVAGAAQEQAERSVSLGRVAFAPRLDLNASYTRLSKIELNTVEFGGMEFELFPQILDNYALRASLRFPVSDYFTSIL